jgi:hypothetical protein
MRALVTVPLASSFRRVAGHVPAMTPPPRLCVVRFARSCRS